MKLSKFLENHKAIEKVIYPGLKSHDQHNLAKQQMHGFGGIVSFYLKADSHYPLSLSTGSDHNISQKIP